MVPGVAQGHAGAAGRLLAQFRRPPLGRDRRGHLHRRLAAGLRRHDQPRQADGQGERRRVAPAKLSTMRSVSTLCHPAMGRLGDALIEHRNLMLRLGAALALFVVMSSASLADYQLNDRVRAYVSGVWYEGTIVGFDEGDYSGVFFVF